MHYEESEHIAGGENKTVAALILTVENFIFSGNFKDFSRVNPFLRFLFSLGTLP